MKKEEKRYEIHLNVWEKFVFKYGVRIIIITGIITIAIVEGINAVIEHFTNGLYLNARNILYPIAVIIYFKVVMYIHAVVDWKIDEMHLDSNTSDETE